MLPVDDDGAPLARFAPGGGRVPAAGGGARSLSAPRLAPLAHAAGRQRHGRRADRGLRAIAGDKTVALIRREPDETIGEIVAGWARNFDPARAKSLGFRADANFSAIINAYIEDELKG